MALLPIIYTSLLITAGLIIVVVFISYISSKMRNNGNEDRILALAYNGHSTNYREASQKPLIITQNENRSVKINVIRRENTPSRDNYSREFTPAVPKVQRVFNSRMQAHVTTNREELVESAITSTYLDNRSSSQKSMSRVEVVNTPSTKPVRNVSSGQVQKSISFNDPINYYYHKNDKEFYTLKAS